MLNGAVVKCTDAEDRESSSLTVISVVNDQGNAVYTGYPILYYSQ